MPQPSTRNPVGHNGRHREPLRGEGKLELNPVYRYVQLGSLRGGQRSGRCKKSKSSRDVVAQGDQLRVTDIRNLLQRMGSICNVAHARLRVQEKDVKFLAFSGRRDDLC